MALLLPEDFLAFLAAGRQLDYDADETDCGQLTLLEHGKLEIGLIWVNARSVDTTLFADPNAADGGFYPVAAVNLVAESATNGSPEHILTWLPTERCFGQCDCDHGVVYLFCNATWSDIADDPIHYLTTMWTGDPKDETLTPYPKYPYAPGRPF